MTTVKELLDGKGRNIWSIAETATVFDAVAYMSEKNIGALVVTSDSSPLAGIISERDYTRKVILKDKASKQTLVSDIMTPDVIYAMEDTPTQKCMTLMLQKKIRHLPIVDGAKPVAMVTLADLMTSIIHEQSMTIEELEGFMFEDQGGEG